MRQNVRIAILELSLMSLMPLVFLGLHKFYYWAGLGPNGSELSALIVTIFVGVSSLIGAAISWKSK